jgi:hypothetical protein
MVSLFKHYVIRYSSEIAEVGGYPQAKLIYHPEEDAYSIKPKSDLSDIIAGIELYGGVKPTSFLNLVDLSPYKGMCVKKEVENLFCELVLPNMMRYPVEFLFKGKPFEYVILVFEDNYTSFIDFEKSVFVEERISKYGATLPIRNLDNWVEQSRIGWEKDFNVEAQSIVVNSKMHKDVDLFVFPRISIDIFGTSRFKEFYSQNALTGLDFKPVSISFSSD